MVQDNVTLQSYWVSVRALFAELGTGIKLMVQLLIDMEAAEKGQPRSKMHQVPGNPVFASLLPSDTNKIV